MSQEIKNITGNSNIDAFLNFGERTFDAGFDFFQNLPKNKYKEHGGEVLKGGASILLGITKLVHDATGDIIKYSSDALANDTATEYTKNLPPEASTNQAKAFGVHEDKDAEGHLEDIDISVTITHDDL